MIVGGLVVLGFGVGILFGHDEASIFDNTSNPVEAFSKYDKLNTNFADAKKQLANAMKNHQQVTFVFEKTGCKDCKKWEGKITHEFYKYKSMKNNHTRYIMVDVSKMSKSDLRWLTANFPMTIVYPHLYTPTVVNLDAVNGNWEYREAFIEHGSYKELQEVFSQGADLQ
ncbi:hypothetical protein FC36_GL000864 [Ligilactobacillus equi DSM 15833 = JCM 10991]|uniref:Thioredoxin domain-containing protein n=2 Tax=Ligilactobacillus equi TaxID=137357 RepID=A0A0R1TPJ0_9LACO|nr:hypothetical protein FC36_GL000864 [Ligilactobacillus equi DSM 15833 = JCM 10991]